jgi:diphthamide synthase (EF-2-diphthine--ammonia ligase)
MNWILTLSLIASLISVASAERVEIRPGKTFCFYEDLQVGQNYGVQFQSDEGEFHVYVQSVPEN